MAIGWARLQYVKRSEGRSAVAAAAYQAREQILDERTGILHDGRAHEPIEEPLEHHLIALPGTANDTLRSAAALWNAAEFAEHRRNSQVAKELLLALPKELDLPARTELALSFVQQHFISKGLAAQLDFHPPHKGGDNYHCHVLISTRRLDGDHFASHKARDLDPAIRLNSSGQTFVTAGELWGHLWREHQHAYFQAHKLDLIVDPPTIHPLNLEFGPKRSWGPDVQGILDRRQALNNALARQPALVFEHLQKTQQHFDGRALDRFLDKHQVTEPIERANLKDKIEALKVAALEEARWAAHVPSRWRKLTIEDEARKDKTTITLRNKQYTYATLSAHLSDLRKALDKAEYVHDWRKADVAEAARYVNHRWREMSFLRRAGHRIGIAIDWFREPRAGDINILRDVDLEKYKRMGRGNDRGEERWSIRHKRLADQIAAAQIKRDELFNSIRPAAERSLTRKQAIADHAETELERRQQQAMIHEHTLTPTSTLRP